MYGNVHNIFIDHVDKSDNDSGYHHHHGPAEFDFIHHPNDECNNDRELPVTIHYDFGSDYILYGPANHTHDKPVTAVIINNPPVASDNIVTSTHRDIHDTSIDWADNIYNVTSGFPYKHNPI